MNGVVPGINPNKTTLIVMAAIAKVYTGELVEVALDVQNERGHGGPLRPAHVREALRRLRRQGLTPRPGYKHRRFFTT
jgi:transcription initiation factor TFIID subunit 11